MFSIWTESYIVYEGKKIYLETPYKKLKDIMKYSVEKEVELEVSGILFGKKKMFKKDKITEWGGAGIF